ncbi:MAG TPA: VWA domain-containing protein [Phycisphaerae bacterium]|nr:VWA domain-containing protein [Phycisphaerae bacterium]
MTSAREEALKGRPEGGAQDEGTETVMDWLTLYLPSWGTSFVLHAAVLILAAFAIWIPPQAQGVTWDTPATLFPAKKHVVEAPDRGQLAERQGEKTPWGLNELNPYRFMRKLELDPFDGIGVLEVSGKIPIIGIGGGPIGGGPESLGAGRGGLDEIFPPIEEARKIVYVVDRSGSMTDSIDYVKEDLKRSIGELPDDKEFHVLFYSSGPCVEMPTRRLVNATERNKQFACEFVDGIIAQGETDPSDALRRAFTVRPEVIYLLTDGEFDRAIVGLVRGLNAGDRVRVHTIGFLYRSGEKVLKQIAAENGGNYKFVSEGDLGR